ncbi:MAG: phosphopantetheine-binding protein [Deltaproteobacteria bacterium]|jgi:acyl carrier protein|nr:phosphopantetheine-binding protein [Deltaproteobacteria bacterium]
MLQSEFLNELREILQRDESIAPDMELRDMAEWDSLAAMSCMAYFAKHFNVKTKIAQYKKLRAVSDLIALAGGAIT